MTLNTLLLSASLAGFILLCVPWKFSFYFTRIVGDFFFCPSLTFFNALLVYMRLCLRLHFHLDILPPPLCFTDFCFHFTRIETDLSISPFLFIPTTVFYHTLSCLCLPIRAIIPIYLIPSFIIIDLLI